MKITQEQCERAVKALNESGHLASHVQGAPNDHGVWLDDVWNKRLIEATSFRLHDEEVNFWASHYDDMMQRRQPTKLVN
mgnify:CR=1 FL=1|tara:strand:- start:126 stop:362 length:237 start_codon:yes stop_codon:yes gene_type:complete